MGKEIDNLNEKIMRLVILLNESDRIIKDTIGKFSSKAEIQS